MKIRMVFKILLAQLLLFSSVCSFSQTKPIIQIYKSSKACDGYVLWMGELRCTLMDLKGNTLLYLPGSNISFFYNKELIASNTFGNLVVYNKSLDVIWRKQISIHHEVINTPEDDIMVLSDDNTYNNQSNDEHHQIRFDNILCFDSAGKEIFRWSTYEHRSYLLNFMLNDTNIFRYHIKGSHEPDSILFHISPGLYHSELFHMNSIQVIPANESEKKNSAFRKGNILLSFCNYSDSLSSFIAIMDPIRFKILWYYVQKDRKQIHTPTMLPNGHILLYVNSPNFLKGDFSLPVIEEIDPITKEVVWNYKEKFLKENRCPGYGSCQRLPNGNTFISDCRGYIYEVTPDKEIVWKWFINNTKNTEPFLYRAYWYPKEKLKWLVIEK